MKRNFIYLIIMTSLFAVSCKKNSNKKTSEPQLTAEQLKKITKEAYIFSYPLVMNYRTMHAQAIASGSFGQWLHFGTSSPADTDIVTPNNDTPYSYAWLDLRSEPWVLTLPKIEKNRFYTSQWDDLWGYVLDNAGSVNDGNNGTTFLLTAPDWNGSIPEGINRVIKGESEFLGSLTRTQLIGGTKDLQNVKNIQKEYHLQPLSSFLNHPAPAKAPSIAWPTWTEGDETTLKYFDYVQFILQFVSTNNKDKEAYKLLESIGIIKGGNWSSSNLDSQTAKAIKSGIAEARAELKKLSEELFIPAKFYNNRKEIGTDYTNRALGVFVGIFGNVTNQSVYLTEVNDIHGNQTDGSKHDYKVTFKAGQLPPVKYFWSYTMYTLPQRWLVANPIKRYSIGSSTEGLKKNKDGSITIYLSKKSPGKSKESNWLPAPDGPFWAVLRTYGPNAAIRNGTWKQPPFEPIN